MVVEKEEVKGKVGYGCSSIKPDESKVEKAVLEAYEK